MCKDGICEHSTEQHQHGHERPNINSMAASATLHCLTGCAIGEILGLVIGTILGLSIGANIALAVVLAFFFGFALSTLPLLRMGIAFGAALSVVFTADTLSIATMELVDNTIMVIIPNAMNADLVNPLFWVSMSVALIAAYFAAYPVNKYLLKKGKGHALLTEHLPGHGHKH